MPFAAWGSKFPVGGSVVVGIGVVEGIESMIIAHDPTVRGGASNPYTFRKVFRGMAIARENRLPIINIVESGGADLPTQAEIFVPGGQLFHDLTQHSAAGCRHWPWSSATRPREVRTSWACATTS